MENLESNSDLVMQTKRENVRVKHGDYAYVHYHFFIHAEQPILQQLLWCSVVSL